LAFHPIKTKKIYQEIMEQLKGMITRGVLQPGDKLPSERDMADSLEVSRASVREALTALAVMGILDIRPGEGTFVRQTSDAETFESLSVLLAVEQNSEAQLMEVRQVLETELAALAAMRATEQDLQKIEESLQIMKSAESIKEAVEADLRFHFAIAEATKNTILLRILNTVADLMHHEFHQARESVYANPSQRSQNLREHEAIYSAIKDRNPGEARARMLTHIINVQALINPASLP